ncbi:hypothetical protein [Parabacteroides chinchillae]|uniref:Uncharacterized protein n=1 Tax=Parabacteroides chinchillae TaxID=871327 RepID=A0A8G2BU99_9BACT|nr:hypothetical protein [Parabacteroides chinchillae]SEF53096.1 hypothetical protein SAMN05444001_102110 [Parabacteroides chinchillae]
MIGLLKALYQKFKQHADWWADYTTELSVVIISITATFYGENLIENYIEANEDLQVMQMMVNELEYDLVELSNIQNHCKDEIAFSELLYRNIIQKENIDENIVNRYYNHHRLYYYWFLKNNALDMTKVSGTMQRMKNKQLLLQLFECYEYINIIKDMDTHYREVRIEQLSNFYAHLPNNAHVPTAKEQWKQIAQDSTFCQYMLTTLPLMAKSITNTSINTQKVLHKTINMINEEYK